MIRSKSKFSYGSRFKSSSLLTLNEIDELEKSIDWRKNYQVKPKEIGRGHFSKVFLVTNETNNKSFAAKVIRRRKGGIDRLDKIRREAEIIRKLNELQIASVMMLIETHESFSEVVLICELANGGCLFNLVEDSDTGLNQNYVKCVIYKLLSALEAMHSVNIVHLDIKADNILLRAPYPSTDIAICDFGLATELKKGISHKELVGTPDYMAPEVVNYEKITFNVDMWSVGVLTYFLLTKISPFMGESKDETLINVSRVQIAYDEIFSQPDFFQAKDFISSICMKSPNLRLSSSTAQNHNWFNDLTNLNIDHPLDVTEHRPYMNNNSTSCILDDITILNNNTNNYTKIVSSNAQRCNSVNFKSLDLCSNFNLDIPDSPFAHSSTSVEEDVNHNQDCRTNGNDLSGNGNVTNNTHKLSVKRDLSNVDEVADEVFCENSNLERNEISSQNEATLPFGQLENNDNNCFFGEDNLADQLERKRIVVEMEHPLEKSDDLDTFKTNPSSLYDLQNQSHTQTYPTNVINKSSVDRTNIPNRSYIKDTTVEIVDNAGKGTTEEGFSPINHSELSDNTSVDINGEAFVDMQKNSHIKDITAVTVVKTDEESSIENISLIKKKFLSSQIKDNEDNNIVTVDTVDKLYINEEAVVNIPKNSQIEDIVIGDKVDKETTEENLSSISPTEMEDNKNHSAPSFDTVDKLYIHDDAFTNIQKNSHTKNITIEIVDETDKGTAEETLSSINHSKIVNNRNNNIATVDTVQRMTTKQDFSLINHAANADINRNVIATVDTESKGIHMDNVDIHIGPELNHPEPVDINNNVNLIDPRVNHATVFSNLERRNEFEITISDELDSNDNIHTNGNMATTTTLDMENDMSTVNHTVCQEIIVLQPIKNDNPVSKSHRFSKTRYAKNSFVNRFLESRSYSLPVDLDEYDNISENCDDNPPTKEILSREISTGSNGKLSLMSTEEDMNDEINVSKRDSIFYHFRVTELCNLL